LQLQKRGERQVVDVRVHVQVHEHVDDEPHVVCLGGGTLHAFLFLRLRVSRVTLAGFNVDADVLQTVVVRAGTTLTPETLSAAYARISRDPRPVSELRRLAVSDVDRARASNQRIVFDMGHHSVAEHAVLNFDLADVSRLVVEAIQGHRLASFTEKSQRYVRLDGGFVVPPEVAGTAHENRLRAFVERCFQTYRELCDALCAAGMDPKAAGEDARYVLPLCVST